MLQSQPHQPRRQQHPQCADSRGLTMVPGAHSPPSLIVLPVRPAATRIPSAATTSFRQLYLLQLTMFYAPQVHIFCNFFCLTNSRKFRICLCCYVCTINDLKRRFVWSVTSPKVPVTHILVPMYSFIFSGNMYFVVTICFFVFVFIC